MLFNNRTDVFIVVIMLVFASSLCALGESSRKWTDKTGQYVIEGEWDTTIDPDSGFIYIRQGEKILRIRMDYLSQEDIKYVLNYLSNTLDENIVADNSSSDLPDAAESESDTQDNTASSDSIEETPEDETVVFHNNGFNPVLQYGHADDIDHLCFSPDGQLLISTVDLKEAILWDVKTGDKIRSYPTGDGPVLFMPDGKSIITWAYNYTDDSTIGEGQIVDVVTGEKRVLFHMPPQMVLPEEDEDSDEDPVAEVEDAGYALCCCLNEDGSRLIRGTRVIPDDDSDHYGYLFLYDTATGKPLQFIKTESPVQAVMFYPQKNYILAGLENGKLCVWEESSGQLVKTLSNLSGFEFASIRQGRDNMVFCMLSGGKNKNFLLTLWNFDTWSKEMEDLYEEPYKNMLFASNNSGVSTYTNYSGDFSNSVFLSYGDNKEGCLLNRHIDEITCSALSPNGEYAATGSADKTVIIMDMKNYTPLFQLGEPDNSSGVMQTVINQEGTLVARGAVNGDIIIYDAQTTSRLYTLKNHGFEIEGLEFSPVDDFLVSCDDEMVVLWNLNTREVIHSYKRHEKTIRDIAFSPDGKRIISSDYDQIVISDTDTGSLIRTIPTEWTFHTAVSHDGRYLASASYKYGVFLWDFNTGRLIRKFSSEPAKSVEFTPDGKKLIAGFRGKEGSNTFTSLVWDVNTGKRLMILSGQSKEKEPSCIAACDLSGKIIMVGSSEGDFSIWNAHTGSLIKRWYQNLHGTYNIVFDKHGNAITSHSGNTILWNSQNGYIKRVFNSVFYEENSFIAKYIDDSQFCIGTSQGGIYIWNPTSSKTVEYLSIHHGDIKDIAINREKTQFLSFSRDDTISLVDMKTLENICTMTVGGTVYSGCFNPDGSKFAICIEYDNDGDEQSYFEIWDIATQKKINSVRTPKNGTYNVLKWEESDKVEANAISLNYTWTLSSNVVEASANQDTPIIQLFDADKPGELEYADSHRDGIIYSDKIILRLEENDNSVRFYEYKSGKELLRAWGFNAGRDWLAITPEGLFDGTPEARRLVAYRVGETLNVQPVEAFFQDFYYPGLLGTIWEGERPMPNVKVKEQIPPEIVIVSPQSCESSEEKVRFEVVVNDKGGGIQKPSITINGIGVGVQEKPVVTEQDVKWSFDLPLTNGENKVVIRSATADGQIACESLPVVIHYLQKLENPPRLFVLTVGVSDYTAGTKNDLQCAAADATALAKAFESNGKKFYGEDNVFIKTLTEKDVTKEKIQQTIQDIAENANPEDVFIFSLAGHGSTVGQLYYYYPVNFPFEDDYQPVDSVIRENGIGGDILNDWINSVPAMKRIVIYDTCQSEAALKRNAMEERKAMEMLSKMTGCYTIAAAAGKEAALELPDVGHGVLTYALLGGLGVAEKGLLKDRSAASEDGLIRVRDWLGFAQDNVGKLSELSFGTEQRAIFQSGANNFPLLKN